MAAPFLISRLFSTSAFESHIKSSLASLQGALKSYGNVVAKIESNAALKPLIQVSTAAKKVKVFVIDEKQTQFVKKELVKMGVDSELQKRELIVKLSKNVDYKKELSKIAEEYKVSVRAKRQECRNTLKKSGELKDSEKLIQKMTDDGIKTIDAMVADKLKQLK